MTQYFKIFDEFKVEKEKEKDVFDNDNKTNSVIQKCCSDNANIIINNTDFICTKCGKTQSSLSTEAEWRYYGCNDSKSANPTRCGMPVNELLPKSSIESTISTNNNNNQNMNNIRRINIWSGSMPYKERSLYLVFNQIQEKSYNNGLSKKIINDAKNIYKQISEKKISRGNNRKGIIASCVYFSCKLNSVPRSTKEIAKIFDINITVMTKGCKIFNNIIQLNELKKSIINNTIVNTESIKSIDFIDRFCSKLCMSNEDIINIKNIAINCEKHNLEGKNTPPSIASGCIYLYCDIKSMKITKKHISDVCLISEVTINKCFRNLQEKQHLLL